MSLLHSAGAGAALAAAWPPTGHEAMSRLPGVASLKPSWRTCRDSRPRHHHHRPVRISYSVVMYRPPGEEKADGRQVRAAYPELADRRRLRPGTTAGANMATNTMPATTPSVAGQPAFGVAQERGTDGVDAGEDREVEGQQSGDSVRVGLQEASSWTDAKDSATLRDTFSGN